MNCEKIYLRYKSDLLKFEYFSIAIDETVDVVGIAQLAIFFRACDSDFNIYEEFLELVPMHDTTTSKDIFIKLLQIFFEYGFDLKKLVCLCTDGAPNMVGRHAGVAAKSRAEIEKVNPWSSFPWSSILWKQLLPKLKGDN